MRRTRGTHALRCVQRSECAFCCAAQVMAAQLNIHISFIFIQFLINISKGIIVLKLWEKKKKLVFSLKFGKNLR